MFASPELRKNSLLAWKMQREKRKSQKNENGHISSRYKKYKFREITCDRTVYIGARQTSDQQRNLLTTPARRINQSIFPSYRRKKFAASIQLGLCCDQFEIFDIVQWFEKGVHESTPKSIDDSPKSARWIRGAVHLECCVTRTSTCSKSSTFAEFLSSSTLKVETMESLNGRENMKKRKNKEIQRHAAETRAKCQTQKKSQRRCAALCSAKNFLFNETH